MKEYIVDFCHRTTRTVDASNEEEAIKKELYLLNMYNNVEVYTIEDVEYITRNDTSKDIDDS